MKLCSILLLLLASSTVAADTATNANGVTMGELRRRGIYRLTGGKIKKPGVQKGAIGFIVAKDTRFDRKRIQDLVKFLIPMRRQEIRYIEADQLPSDGLDRELKDRQLNAGVFVGWNDKCDLPMIYAPEKHFAIVNVRNLKPGAKDDAVFAERIFKESARAFAYVCGAGGSMGGEGIMNVTSVDELDECAVQFPFDVINRFNPYLKSIGVTSWQESTYRMAVQEGWAPAPTNKYQQAIWDKAHSAPSNPMKIEFDPKKGR